MTLYGLLGVDAQADHQQLWDAYQRARTALPRSGWRRWVARLQGRSEASLAEAYQVLRDPTSRARYDQKLASWLFVYGMPPGH